MNSHETHPICRWFLLHGLEIYCVNVSPPLGFPWELVDKNLDFLSWLLFMLKVGTVDIYYTWIPSCKPEHNENTWLTVMTPFVDVPYINKSRFQFDLGTSLVEIS